MRTLIEMPLWHHSTEELNPLQALFPFFLDYSASDRLLKRYHAEMADYLMQFEVERIFQDSYTGNRSRLEELAQEGSPACGLIMDLMERGAVIEKTEQRVLWYIHVALLYLADSNGDEKKVKRVMSWRDRGIAKRIDRKLRDGETGVLSIGAAHNVGEEIMRRADDITIIRPQFCDDYLALYDEL